MGPETDSATCQECLWSASGPRSDEAGDQHFFYTGHNWTLHRQAPDPRESKG